MRSPRCRQSQKKNMEGENTESNHERYIGCGGSERSCCQASCQRPPTNSSIPSQRYQRHVTHRGEKILQLHTLQGQRERFQWTWKQTLKASGCAPGTVGISEGTYIREHEKGTPPWIRRVRPVEDPLWT